MSGSTTVILVLLSLVELGALVWLWRGWSRKEDDCAGCQAELTTCRAALKGLVAHVGLKSDDDAEFWAPAVWTAWYLSKGDYREYHHPRRGTNYRMLMQDVRFNCSGRLRDGDPVVVYQDLETGKLSCRGQAEFLDGRFVSLTPPEQGS